MSCGQRLRTKGQRLRKKVINKQNQFIRKQFSKRRDPVSELETTALQALHNLKASIKKTSN